MSGKSYITVLADGTTAEAYTLVKDEAGLGFSVLTADGKLSAHYENTVLITDGEPEILTVTEGL